MIDLEFAYIGPASFDVGMLLANYLFSHYQHMSQGNRELAYVLVDLCKHTGKYKKCTIYSKPHLYHIWFGILIFECSSDTGGCVFISCACLYQ